jgi:hypothetical protein
VNSSLSLFYLITQMRNDGNDLNISLNISRLARNPKALPHTRHSSSSLDMTHPNPSASVTPPAFLAGALSSMSCYISFVKDYFPLSLRNIYYFPDIRTVILEEEKPLLSLLVFESPETSLSPFSGLTSSFPDEHIQYIAPERLWVLNYSAHHDSPPASFLSHHSLDRHSLPQTPLTKNGFFHKDMKGLCSLLTLARQWETHLYLHLYGLKEDVADESESESTLPSLREVYTLIAFRPFSLKFSSPFGPLAIRWEKASLSLRLSLPSRFLCLEKALESELNASLSILSLLSSLILCSPTLAEVNSFRRLSLSSLFPSSLPQLTVIRNSYIPTRNLVKIFAVSSRRLRLLFFTPPSQVFYAFVMCFIRPFLVQSLIRLFLILPVSDVAFRKLGESGCSWLRRYDGHVVVNDVGFIFVFIKGSGQWKTCRRGIFSE